MLSDAPFFCDGWVCTICVAGVWHYFFCIGVDDLFSVKAAEEIVCQTKALAKFFATVIPAQAGIQGVKALAKFF